jgi:hypothetical protein
MRKRVLAEKSSQAQQQNADLDRYHQQQEHEPTPVLTLAFPR